MKVSLSTGGEFDFIRFRAETVAECAELVDAGLSEFVRVDAPDRMHLQTGGHFPSNSSTVELVIRLSSIFRASPEEQAVINAEHDAVS